MRKKTRSLVILGAMVCAVSLPSFSADKKEIKIAYLPITHALPLFVENEMLKSKFENYSLTLVRFGSWPEVLDSLNSGRVDGASILIELALKAKEQGIDLKAVALGHRDGNVVVVANSINSASDLRGKTIAIPHRLSSHNVLLNLLLAKANLKRTDITVIEIAPPEMPAALAEGRIAGYIVAEPFGAKSIVSGKGKVLFESQDLWKDSVCCSLVLRNDFIKGNHEAAREFVRNYLTAADKSHKRDADVKKIAETYLKSDAKVLDLSLKWISYNDLAIKKKDYDVLVKYLSAQSIIDHPPSYEDFVDTSLAGGKVR
jgi:NitT/TauT family transport system substrate-binding protein